MRICIIGKYPPIQGGVSMRTFWSAQDLAERGHEVHVVTNAKEVRAPYRIYMQDEDWRRAEHHPGPGRVQVHWTDPVDRSQRYIPMASPFVSKLASLAAHAHERAPFDVIFAYYLEPYAVAGYLAAQMTGAPLVVRMAGSDAGKLWNHPQLGALYDHVLRHAERVIADGSVAAHARKIGVASARIRSVGPAPVPEALFAPDAPPLDAVALAARVRDDPGFADQVFGALPPGAPCFGIYGKLGEKKGSFALLRAMAKLAESDRHAGLLVMAHGLSRIEDRFRALAERLGLGDRVLQIPFLPHWRVPAFLSGCLAVCCLEQDFPIAIHSPVVAREVLLAGKCLVGSEEVIGKLPQPERLIDGYNCVAVPDATDADLLAGRLARILDDPAPAADLGRRGHAYALDVQAGMRHAALLENVLSEAAQRRETAAVGERRDRGNPDPSAGAFPLSRMVWAHLRDHGTGAARSALAAPPGTTADAETLLSLLAEDAVDGGCPVATLRAAVRLDLAVESAIAGMTAERSKNGGATAGRLDLGRWGLAEDAIEEMHPYLRTGTRIVSVPFAAAGFIAARSAAEFPPVVAEEESFILVCADGPQGTARRFLISEACARMLARCDGTKTVGALFGSAASAGGPGDMPRSWAAELLEIGCIGLRRIAARSRD